MRQTKDRDSGRRYPASHTSPWVFLSIAGITLFFILSGVFKFEPVMHVFRWLAVVL